MDIRYRQSINGRRGFRTILVNTILLLTSATATAQVVVNGNVYGGGNLADVKVNTEVNMSAGTVKGNIFGGGKGKADNFTCDKAMVGIVNAGEDAVNYPNGYPNGNTTVTITNGTVDGDVYGGGEVSRVEMNTTVTIGEAGSTTSAPIIKGHVFGAGKGVETHGYSALVRGNSTVTIQGKAEVWLNVYGGGEKASVGRYQVATTPELATQYHVAIGMPCYLKAGGKCTVNIQDNATIGNADINDSGDIFGAGQGVRPAHSYDVYSKYNDRIANNSKRMVNHVDYNATTNTGHNPDENYKGKTWDYYVDEDGNEDTRYVWEYFPTKAAYLQYVETLGRASETDVVIGGKRETTGESAGNITTSSNAPTVKGAVYGGSESGFVYYSTAVNIKKGQIDGDVFGGGKGLESFSEAGRVRIGTNLTINDGTIKGNVYGGGERGLTLGNVDVDMTGGTVKKDVYGGGALADTNKGTWEEDKYVETHPASGKPVTGLYTRSGAGTNESPYTYTEITSAFETSNGSTTYYIKGGWAEGKTSASYKTHVSLMGGKIEGDAYGGGLGDADTPAYVYGDVKVELNGKTTDTTNPTTTIVGNNDKGCIVNRVFGCNNLNGTPKGHVQVYVYATQNKDKATVSSDKTTANLHNGLEAEGATTTYDVKAVYGGGNLAAYIPADALLDYNETNKTTVEAACTEVYINGCDVTSIKQVYAGGNAAPVSASHVMVNSVYEIEEVFGGGNGADEYTLNGETYQNPGANVGYYNYTHFVKNTTSGKYEPVDNTSPDYPDASTKKNRQTNYRFGSGIARTEIRGGTIHVVYGGSNKKGNISTTALSVYEGSDDTCPMKVEQTYGGGKDAPIDGEVVVELACAKGIEEIFGGAKNADINADIDLRVTNGSALKRVFGGNNTSGAINGSITVTIEEGGCEPIRIDELYLGGYLAPYSVYGYEMNNDGTYKYKEGATDEEGNSINERIPLTSGNNPKQDPRINVISATHIGNIYGGGYKAKLVGNPHVNVNMKPGKILARYVVNTEDNPFVGEHKDNENHVIWKGKEIAQDGDGILEIGTIDNIFGGGNLADIVGNTYVEIGTGRWISEWDANGPVYESEDASGNKYTYKIKTPAVKYSQSECDTNNASLPGAISTSTELTAAQATRLNELLSISTYSANSSPSSEHAEAYNATLDGYITTADIKTPAVWAWYTKNGDNYVETSTVPTPLRNAATITGNVFGGGYGLADETTFTCEKAMVGVDNEAADPTKRNGGTNVVIENGTVGTLEGGALKAGTGNVYGGGRLARVERNTVVTIGSESGIGSPVILGDIYGAGMGKDTHGYSGLVRGNATVTIQDDAKVRGNVYGGGEKASLGRFFVAATDALATAHGVEKGMPYDLKSGGTSTVIIRGSAEIGPETGDASDNSGNVFGAGKGADPSEISNPGRYYLNNSNAVTWESYAYNENDEDKTNKMAFHKYILTLGITNKGNVIIDGGSTVKGSVYGGGSLGNVLSNTEVNISAEKRTSGSYAATSGTPVISGNVYGGGKGKGDTFTCEKAMIGKDGAGVDANYVPTDYSDGNTTVVIGNGTVNGSVYGGGEVGRVEMNTSVTVGLNSVADGGTSAPEIMQNVFGGGKGLETHGYSALVRGNPTVTVQAGAKVRGNVYGGGQIASVARYRVAATDDEGAPYGVKKGMPYALALTSNSSGLCTVTVQGNAVIGPESIDENVKTTNVGHVFGAGKGILPGGTYAFSQGTTKRMVALRNGEGIVTDNSYWETFTSEADYITFIKTLALASQTDVTIDGSATVKGSVFGGSESGFVQFDTNVNVTGGTIGVQGKGGADFGNVYGGGKGDAQYNGANGHYVDAGLVKGNTEIKISQASGKTTQIYHNIYGGGAYGTVGEFAYDPTTGMPTGRRTYTIGEEVHNTTGGKAKIAITGGTIGTTGQNNGMIFGSSRGDVGAPGEIHDRLAWVYDTSVTIGDTTLTTPVNTAPLIKGSIYGGGENGHVYHNSWVHVNGGTIGVSSGDDVTVTNADNTTTTYKPYNYPYRGNVYGGGCGTDKYYVGSVPDGHTANDGEGTKYNPLSGIVQGNAKVIVDGGHVVHNVYGAGAMGSVGTITNFDNLDDKDASNNYLYKHAAATNDGKESYYDFGLSWPYQFTYSGTGQATVDIAGGAEIGVNQIDATGGHVFGAARGGVEVGESNLANHRYEEAKLANVRTTQVTIGTATGDTQPTIRGSVYGGGEDGHVYENTSVTINKGSIAHSVFGGGKGTSTFKVAELWDVPSNSNDNSHTTLTNQPVHSWTAGRVYGNTTVTMNGGSVGYYIYGGGNLASVGKGNYAGGSDDYSTGGYGELGQKNNDGTGGPIWTANPAADTYPYYFANSGIATVNVYGGTLGIAGFDAESSGLPYGSVFGGSRGTAAKNVGARSPRYRYVPDFFLGYVNNTVINIGDATNSTEGYTGPTINGSVYGGGQDGHVRNSTVVNINKGKIAGQTNDNLSRSGNVFGAGSGIGTYTENGKQVISNSSGSVTCTTQVNVNGGEISGIVYGGGAMASVGPPKTPAQSDFETKEATETKASHSSTKVTLNGGTIGGDVYGASRGPGDAFYAQQFTNNNITYAPDDYATVIWSDVVMSSESTAVVNGSVYGGGEGGRVKKNTKVDLLGGTIKGDAYGGGKGTVTTNIEANVGGDAEINLGSNGGSSATAFWITNLTDDTDNSVVKSGRVFGCNNLNGSPQGNVTVHVWKTAEGNTSRTAGDANNLGFANKTNDVTHTYELAAVYGGGNLADYTTTESGKKTNVIIETCDVSVESVYGGGNAAAVPETDVLVKGAYEIKSVFGGGNGRDKTTTDNGITWNDNPGANVNGNANTLLTGGYIHEAYGGSNKKGTITGNVTIDIGTGGECTLDVGKVVGAGKNADVNGDLIVIMGCKPNTKIPLLFAGADDANVNGNVELTITSGNFGKVFGGNNEGGVIRGHIKLNIEETGDCGTPITIDELYLGGNEAAYSVYGYYLDSNNKLQPRTAEMHSITDPEAEGYKAAVGNPTTDATHTFPFAQPELNIISCTSIGQVFGGGLGSTAIIYGNPTVNINMIPGNNASNIKRNGSANAHDLGAIGDVYGGGDAAAVYGNTTVNIGTAETVTVKSMTYDAETDTYTAGTANVEGAYITGNVYGGGKLANVGAYHEVTDDGVTSDVIDIVGNTYVNIGANNVTPVLDNDSNPTGDYTFNAVNYTQTDYQGITIGGNVYGGGMGEAAGDKTTTTALAGAFRCGKAMVTGGTNICIGSGTIGNGTTGGSVYGGGELGRVEGNTAVMIGVGDGVASGTPTSAPVVRGNVFGAGKGVNTHGYSALVRGKTNVTVKGNAQVAQSVYGGGEIASVGRYKVAQTDGEVATYGVEKGMPYALDDSLYPESGYCYVTVGGYAEIGPNDMQMKKTGGPDDTGYVFGAGKGILPYEDTGGEPGRIFLDNKWESYIGKEKDYLKYIETLSLTTQTYVTINGHAFVKGSIYGGSENGHVQHDTYVYIKDNCQIGNGWDKTANSGAGGGVNARYDESLFIDPTTAKAEQINNAAASLHECAHWDFGKASNNDGKLDTFLPYDKYVTNEEGATTASDGHTFFGNVFGGGSGLYPYIKEKANSTDPDQYEWLRSAGRVYGNTNVEITGGHILTSVYGGCELTDVGNGVSVEEGKGKCFVKMSGGTLGVPRTLTQISAHPVTCYLFGAGKGDQRTHFNQWTNVGNVRVEINDSISRPIIYGSIFGGGEDGHVLGDVFIHISKKDNGDDPIIGTWGTSYVDGNVFGGGRGFGGDALTAGVVSGNVGIKIDGGKMLGSIYGGGRLGSVGTYLVPSDDANYGKLIPDGKKQTIGNGDVTLADDSNAKHGQISIDISGGTIGNKWEYDYIAPTVTGDALTAAKVNMPNTEHDAENRLAHTKGGNVFAGCMGRLTGLAAGTYLDHWTDLGKARSTKLTISGGTIKSCVYGGAELGTVGEVVSTTGEGGATVNTLKGGTDITITGGTIGTEITETITEPQDDGNGDTTEVSTDHTRYTFGSVFGGGYGSTIEKIMVNKTTENPTGTETNPKFTAGLLHGDTKIDMQGGAVKASIYGGGEVASVEGSTDVRVNGTSTVGVSGFGGAKMGNVYGGGSGHPNIVRCGKIFKNSNVTISGSPIIYHNVYGGGAYGTVGDFNYKTNSTNEWGTLKVVGVDGLETSGTGVATVTITGGTIGVDGNENGMVFGSSRGDIAPPDNRDDHAAWVYDTNITIGTPASGTEGEEGYVAASGPSIKGSVYGSGENGHTFNNTVVTINGGTIGIAEGGTIGSYSGAAYPYRGNVYGGGCGTDKYYLSGTAPAGHTLNDGEGDTYNPLSGIVYGNTTININGGTVVHNVYGAGAMGSVGKTVTTDGVTSITSGGQTTINISGGTVGVSGTVGDGNVFGAARGDSVSIQTDVALVKNTSVNIKSNGIVKGNVYGGGETGDVMENTEVNVCAEHSNGNYVASSGTPTIGGNVYGGGKGAANSFTCAKAMVGVEGDGVTITGESPNETYALKDGGTAVRIYNGTVGTLVNGILKEGTGHVYGGGEIARVERNTLVEIGAATGSSAPIIEGSVFAAGAGLETHGYSALVRGTSTVTVQGSAQVWENVYGGGEMASVGRYWVATTPTIAAANNVAIGMPYGLKAGGTGIVTIKGNAVIGKAETVADTNKGRVYGAGQGVTPADYDYAVGTDGENGYKLDDHKPKRMVMHTYYDAETQQGHNPDELGKSWVWYSDANGTSGKYVWEYFADKSSYLKYIETLGISAESDVVIGGTRNETTGEITASGNPTIWGAVLGGSESGFVYRDTDLKILGGVVKRNVYGGGRGLESFAEAGRVGRNTKVAVSGGNIDGNVYGGGNLGDVGTITKEFVKYNYVWTGRDGRTANTGGNNDIAPENNQNTGICTVTVSGGTIGDGTPGKGNVFGAGKGSYNTWWCEKAIVFATDVSISKGTVTGNVYGGGEVGRVGDDTKVTIGPASGSDAPAITGSVFGAGAGLATHGYSALVRGNSDVVVQGKATVGGSVYGGGEIASVGRFSVVGGLPKAPQSGGTCTVKVKGEAKIGSDGTSHHVFGACKGVTPEYTSTSFSDKSVYSVQLVANIPKDANKQPKAEHTYWDYYDEGHEYIKVYYETEADYLSFLKTLALTSNTHVTIDESAEVYGSVYGGGERGITLGGVDVNMVGGTVKKDVYGGGSLADSNTAMWSDGQLYIYAEVSGLEEGAPVKGYYTKNGNVYTPVTYQNAVFGVHYYAHYTTNVNLTGGMVEGSVYGGGLGQLAKAAQPAQGTEGEDGYVPAVSAQDAVPAKVYGEVLVKLNETKANDVGCAVKGNIFGCNNLNGCPQSAVTVHIYETVKKNEQGAVTAKPTKGTNTYEVNAVYGGGNLAAFIPDYSVTADTAVVRVIIDGCEKTSIGTVYGGGNAASVPATEVTVNGTYEIGQVFGGGNGFDNYQQDGKWYQNPGANVGYKNYTHLGSGTGTESDPILAVENTAADEAANAENKDASTKEKRAYYAYGLGKTHATIYGGTVHDVYGGSNRRGNVRVEARTTLEDLEQCSPYDVGEAYGGGRNAEMDGDAVLEIGCISGLAKACGGAANADVNGDVELNITNGTYERVFGGNDLGGAIRGSITVNIEETGCRPIIIGQLYGGGNQAAYSVYGYDSENKPLKEGEAGSNPTPVRDPQVNVNSFTSIGTIFGGGYGVNATMVGNPQVNINVYEGKYYNDSKSLINENAKVVGSSVKYSGDGYDTGIAIPNHEKGNIGAINTVFGGGNEAKVIGNPSVNIGNEAGDEVYAVVKIDAGTNLPQNIYTRSGTADPYTYTAASGTADAGTTYYLKTVKRVDIRDNIYGGGNNAEVEGNTNVQIGKKIE